MITAYLKGKTLTPLNITTDNSPLLNDALWIDLQSPTLEEERLVEKLLGIEIPTREEMLEIELSSRLYKENGTLFMTANMLAQAESIEPKQDAVTFVLSPQRLITIRYINPQAFKLFINQLTKIDATHFTSVEILITLLDATIDRLADILEIITRQLDDYSKTLFAQNNTSEHIDYQKLLQKLGAIGDITTKTRESLVNFSRLLMFFNLSDGEMLDTAASSTISTLSKDISSLSDQASFLSTKINFLLDATLGMVSIEQNNIIKIFSVAAVIFLPPTLIASIYGMNFSVMPELSWKYGYLIAIGLMLTSAWLPYKFFKKKKWL